MMIDIRVKHNEDGYDLVAEYIKHYWKKRNFYDDVIVRLNTSFDGVKWEMGRNQYAAIEGYNTVVFEHDWWEGEKYIQITSIVNISKLELPENTDWMEE